MPYLVEKVVEPLTLDVSANTYYIDAIARELGAADASMVSLSRCIGKSSSETRLYSHAPNSYKWDKENFKDGSYLNARASYLSGQNVYGDAILATIGYLWKSCDLFLEDVSPRTYYSWSGDVGVDETGVEPNEIDLVMTQNDCQDQRSLRLFKCCKWSTEMLRSFYSHTCQGKHGNLEVNREGIYLQHDKD
ncbi:hypothetical protein HanXRQr2_Chr15g0721071 [Helianthus annuus]|uniref:Small RNA 2'-O-methyltransferase Hen1 La-motif C-terminal domain-containing protein n=1 Tax=Helianthus annuus TaxID=4232 RepID=A0A9K3H4C1_HELAN|nr:hypothetical protein HanXRQr2_Chr15g0721071 [Helianthus annuus]KAJ0453252.1 putative small RNA 2'-O-methyltransferase Hen1, La-motif domain-containing protein [Helianthus annuus]KAJ0475167.1 putative small RNA 2'-O-methyltransferase Hen1, La-motif domain-containing protein [Helianthus annuus]KAJ0650723.1 putative small RNA 2'-O-methyltransferase Hen1, La-motif domain-containing protein [Helianthus annuus]KAJ0654476.1 putative small RNA 2'-O-methyltransferase Hen1, La-motif domain-containing 